MAGVAANIPGGQLPRASRTYVAGNRFVDVAHVGRIAPGTAMRVTMGDTDVAVFNVDGRMFAIDDLCARCGSSLASGRFAGMVVACCGCDWQYDVSTGSLNGIPALCIDTFEAKIVHARVLVAMLPKVRRHSAP